MWELNRIKDALQYFEKAIKIKPDYAEAFHSLGDAYRRLGNKKDALETYSSNLN